MTQQAYDREEMAELGEIATNVLAALRRGDVKFEDVRDYLELIGINMSVLERFEKVRTTVETVESVLISIFAPYRLRYYEYIQSPAWKRKADAAKKAAGYRCQVCNNSQDDGAKLEAHHRTYARLGHERPEDITVLCRECHGLYEKNKKIRKARKERKTA